MFLGQTISVAADAFTVLPQRHFPHKASTTPPPPQPPPRSPRPAPRPWPPRPPIAWRSPAPPGPPCRAQGGRKTFRDSGREKREALQHEEKSSLLASSHASVQLLSRAFFCSQKVAVRSRKKRPSYALGICSGCVNIPYRCARFHIYFRGYNDILSFLLCTRTFFFFLGV